MFGYLCCVKQIYYFLIIDVAVVTLEMIDQYITTICLRLLHVRNYYYYYTHLTACCPGQHGQVGTKKGKTSLKLSEARDDDVLGNSSISWTICRQSASRSRQITTPTPRHSIFTGRMLFLTPYRQYQSKE